MVAAVGAVMNAGAPGGESAPSAQHMDDRLPRVEVRRGRELDPMNQPVPRVSISPALPNSMSTGSLQARSRGPSGSLSEP